MEKTHYSLDDYLKMITVIDGDNVAEGGVLDGLLYQIHVDLQGMPVSTFMVPLAETFKKADLWDDDPSSWQCQNGPGTMVTFTFRRADLFKAYLLKEFARKAA